MNERAAEADARARLCAAMRELTDAGLNVNAAGNASVRWQGGFLITPTGVPAARLAPERIVAMSADGTVQGAGKPSSEWRFHRDIYASRPEAGAVVHAHAPHATALACARREIPPFHYMIAVAGGDSIRCAGYALFGTQALSDEVLAALEGRRACLLANHGLIAIGEDIDRALALAREVENLARQYLLTLAAGGPVLLDADQMRAVLERFETYGKD